MTGADAVDLIAQAQGAQIIPIPVESLDGAFFRLKTGIAGDMMRKFVTYRRVGAIVGGINPCTAESAAFRDLVYEAPNDSPATLCCR